MKHRSRLRVLAILVAALHPASAVVARATTCQDICPGTGDCVITTNRTVQPGSDLDCSGRSIILRSPLGTLEVSNGWFTLRAHNVTVEATRHITASLSGAWVPFGMALKLSGTLDATGFLRANSTQGGGTITVEAIGDIFVRDATGEVKGIRAIGEAADKPGGSVRLVSDGVIVIDDEILAENQGVTGTGGGGQIFLKATGSIAINSLLSVHGRGAGGTIRILTPGNLDVTQTLKADGGGAEGNGGVISLQAERIVINGPLVAQGGIGTSGGQSEGGVVDLRAGALGLSVNSNIDVTGGADGGGTIQAYSAGNLTMGAGVSLTSRADLNGGDAGEIELRADQLFTIGQNAILDASGHSASTVVGYGAGITLGACELSIATLVTIKATGYDGGEVTLVGQKTLTVGATVNAAGVDTPGEIELVYRGTCSNAPTKHCLSNADCTIGCNTGACSAPTTTGATFTPAPPRYDNDRNLGLCSP